MEQDWRGDPKKNAAEARKVLTTSSLLYNIYVVKHICLKGGAMLSFLQSLFRDFWDKLASGTQKLVRSISHADAKTIGVCALC